MQKNPAGIDEIIKILEISIEQGRELPRTFKNNS
jgi:hypothetical protein